MKQTATQNPAGMVLISEVGAGKGRCKCGDERVLIQVRVKRKQFDRTVFGCDSCLEQKVGQLILDAVHISFIPF